MSRIKTALAARAEAVGSTLLHQLPDRTRKWIAQRFMELSGPRDKVLRWRVATAAGTAEHWQEAVRVSQKSSDARFTEMAVLAVEQEVLSAALADTERRPAVAYRLGELAMVGVDELTPTEALFLPEHNNPRRLGVIMRIGDGPLCAGIGTVGPNGRDFQSLPARFIRRVDVLGQEFNRV